MNKDQRTGFPEQPLINRTKLPSAATMAFVAVNDAFGTTNEKGMTKACFCYST